MSLDKVWFSFIEYRPDPSEPEKDRLVLGSVVSAQTGRGHSLILHARKELTQAELKLMDGISRELLATPFSYLNAEIERLLKTHPIKGGGLLSALSRVHRWSLHATPPRQLQVERHLSQTNYEALSTVGLDILIAHMLGREVRLTGRLRAKRIIPEDWHDQLPPAWQLTTGSFAAAAHSP